MSALRREQNDEPVTHTRTSRLPQYSRDDARYWHRRPKDHGEDGLYREGPRQAACGVWELVGNSLGQSREERARREVLRAREIEREIAEARQARRRAQPAPVALQAQTPHPRASRKLFVPFKRAA